MHAAVICVTLMLLILMRATDWQGPLLDAVVPATTFVALSASIESVAWFERRDGKPRLKLAVVLVVGGVCLALAAIRPAAEEPWRSLVVLVKFGLFVATMYVAYAFENVPARSGEEPECSSPQS